MKRSKKRIYLDIDGDLLDTDGNVIATSRTVYDIHFDCCMIESEPEWNEKSRMLAQEIAAILPERTAARSFSGNQALYGSSSAAAISDTTLSSQFA